MPDYGGYDFSGYSIYSMFTLWFLMFFFFICQLTGATLLFTVHLKKRKRFLIRASVSFVCMTILSVGVMYFFLYFGSYYWGYVSIYIIMFLATFACFMSCYNESAWTVMFCCIAGYLTQHPISKIYRLFLIITGLSGAPWISFACNLCFYAAGLVCIYFIFARRANKNISTKIENRNILFLSVAALIVTIFINNLFDMYARSIVLLDVAGSVLAVFTCIFILSVQSGLLDKSRYRQDMEIMEQLWEEKRKQFDLTKENIDIINIKCHDLKHQLYALRTSEGEISKEAVREIEDAVSFYDSNIKTNNEILDTMLTEKSLYCREHGIKLTCMVDGRKLSYISSADMCSLFGNAIENAIEAVGRVKDPDKRVVSVTSEVRSGMNLIRIVNYFGGKVEFEDGLPVTDKGDKNFHGFGMKSIRAIVEKYGGNLSVSTEDDEFYLNIVLPLP